MAAPMRREAVSPARITCTPGFVGGSPRIDGTRIPAMAIVAQIRGGMSEAEIFEDYPGLPPDGIEAVRRWADENGVSLERGAESDPFEYDPSADVDPFPR